MEKDEYRRKEYLEEIKDIKIEDIVYVDESGIDKNIIKETAWIKKGNNIIQEVSGKKHSRTTIIAGLNLKDDIIAPIYFKGNTNTEIFINWLKEDLLPKLRSNQVIIMDNASFHKSNKIKELIESYGCRLIFLPSYSPDFNPIEKYWSFLKNKLRKLALYCSDFFKNLNEVLKMKYVKVEG